VSLTYKHLDDQDKKAVEADVAERDAPPAVDDALAAAWEADHYAHSLLLAAASDKDEQKRHVDAMKAIEDALKAAGR
jgi:hypothetical protein